jgi:hypothetical protein
MPNQYEIENTLDMEVVKTTKWGGEWKLGI